MLLLINQGCLYDISTFMERIKFNFDYLFFKHYIKFEKSLDLKLARYLVNIQYLIYYLISNIQKPLKARQKYLD